MWCYHVEYCTKDSRAQFAGKNLVHNLGQIKNGHVEEFIRRRFVFDSLEDGGDAQGKMFGQEDINLPQPHPIQKNGKILQYTKQPRT